MKRVLAVLALALAGLAVGSAAEAGRLPRPVFLLARTPPSHAIHSVAKPQEKPAPRRAMETRPDGTRANHGVREVPPSR